MSDPLHPFRCILEGDIVIDSLIPANTSGAFCDLLTATHPTAGKLALKRPRGNCDEHLIARIEIEAGVWASLKHPRILQFLGIHKISNEIYFVSAFAHNGSLPGFLECHPEVDRGRLVIEIVEGLAYLHQCGIIHGDLKGNNVLISGEHHVLLCDFGLAKHVTSRTSTSLRGVGSIPWQSPELLQDACRRTFQSDVYAFGITVYEVLSGMEPYTHHKGIVSIITSVVFNGERPPKDPLTAFDGTSYLRFWDEASMCWAEDSTLRPRIIDVLNRLDRQRAEALINFQHLVFEDSLVPFAGGHSTSKIDSALDLSAQDSDGTSIRDTLDWAYQIRSRLNTLVNARQPISQLPFGIMAKIMMIEIATWSPKRNLPVVVAIALPFPFSRRSEFSWTGRFSGCAGPSIQKIVRCAHLRTVCRAWRDAIDSTPEFTRFMLVDPRTGNVESFPQTNSQGLLECFVKPEDDPTLGELSCFLTPLADRLCSLNAYSPNVIIKPTRFSMLRAIRIFGSRVSDTFAVDLLGMLNTHPNLTELILQSLKCDAPVLEDSSRLRVDHPGLQRVDISWLSSPLQSYLLYYLGLKSSATLIARGVEPGYLNRPNSAIGNLVRAQARREFSSVIRGRLTLEPVVPGPSGEEENDVCFQWPSQGHYSRELVEIEMPLSLWESSMLTNDALSNLDAMDLIRVLSGSGIVDSLDLNTSNYLGTGNHHGAIVFERNAIREVLHYLPSVKRLIIRTTDADRFLPILMEPNRGATDDGQLLCPRLTDLEVKRRRYDEERTSQGDIRTGVEATIYEFIKKRQGKARLPDGPGKLERVGIPWSKEFIGSTLAKDPVFDGIEFYEAY